MASGRARLADVERLCQALGDRTRLRLLNLMRDGEICVCFFVEILKTNQPKISRHLAYMRKAGIVTARRDGKWVHYSIERPEDPHVARMLDEVLAWAEQDKELRADRERLMRVCCSPQMPVRLQLAPKPSSVDAASS